jgi:anti-sigma B factor antagonist
MIHLSEQLRKLSPPICFVAVMMCPSGECQSRAPPSGRLDLMEEGTVYMATVQRRLDIEEIGNVSIAKFVDRKILDESNIQVIGNQMFGLVDEDGRKKIVLDFTNVEYLSSAALGKLITMDKKVKAAKGKLRLCCIRPEIYEVFEITRLNKIFDIRNTQEEALEGF